MIVSYLFYKLRIFNWKLHIVLVYDDIFDKDEIFDEDDPEALSDPIMEINLLEYLTQYLQTMASQPRIYDDFKPYHNDIEKEVLKQIGIIA